MPPGLARFIWQMDEADRDSGLAAEIMQRRVHQCVARVCAGAERDVAPLSVGYHQQAARTGVGGHVLKRSPAGCPQPLEAGELQLYRYARLRGGIDQSVAMDDDRARSALRGGPVRRRRAAVRPERSGVGVDAEHDLGLAPGHARGEGVAERSPGQRPFTALFSPLPAVKRGTRDAAIWMRSPVRGLTPSRAPRSLT